MRFLVAWLGSLALVVASGSAWAQPEPVEPPPVDLPALLEAAQTHSPALSGADASIRAARARLNEARLSPFLQFRVRAGFGLAPEAQGTPIFSRDSELPLDNPWRPTTSVGVSGVVPLYTFGLIRAGRDAARAGVEAASQDRIRRAASLRYDVQRAYLGLQLALDTRQMLNEGQRHLRRAQSELRERLEDGDEEVNQEDAWRLAAAHAELLGRQSQTTSLESVSRAALNLLTGLSDFAISDCPLAPVEHAFESLDALVEASSETPEARALSALVAAREAATTAARARSLPQFGLGLSANHSFSPGITDQNNPFVSDPANRTSLSAGLVAQVSLDVAGAIHRTRRAEAELHAATSQREEAMVGLRLRAARSVEQLRDASRRLEAWQEGQTQMRAWFVSAAQGYQMGTSDADDLIDAIQAYFNARFNLLQAIHDHNLAIASIERATGQRLSPESWRPSCE